MVSISLITITFIIVSLGLSHHQVVGCERQKKTSDSPKSCPKCGANLIGKRGLKAHIQSVHKESIENGQKSSQQSFKCTQCPTICSSRKNLKNHRKVAHLEGGIQALPYSCSECGKLFLKQSYLEVKAYAILQLTIMILISLC